MRTRGKVVMDPKELFGKDYDEFCEVDPFNLKNEVRGYISRKGNEYYGALIITGINNKKVPEQLIMGTPKMVYPFTTLADGTRKYRFPSAKEIEIYEKLDGTNILAYSYTDGVNTYYSYKTRLRPFLNEGSRWGKFCSMWREVAGGHLRDIEGIMRRESCNLSFELYGAKNVHLVVYDVPLAYALLFGVTNAGRIISPAKLGDLKGLTPVSIMSTIGKDYVYNYEETQRVLNDGLSQVEENYYKGVEGTVWYMHLHDGRCIQLKCKPEIIEAIHFAAGAGINKTIIIATCWNAFENVEVLTVEFIKQLLAEEFKPVQIEAVHPYIEDCISFVNKELEFRQSVLREYEALGMNINLYKAEIMRALSGKFDRNKMRKVYSTIINFG